MDLITFIEKNLSFDNPLLTSICLGIIFLIIYDFYHLLFSSVLTWFKRDK